MATVTHHVAHPRGRVWFDLVLGLMIAGGVAQVLQGAVAVAEGWAESPGGELFARFDLSTWGWIQVELGFALVAVTLIARRHPSWARRCGIPALAAAVGVNLLFLMVFPLTAIPLLALDLTLIWALAAPGGGRR
jgi:hypothetical protein